MWGMFVASSLNFSLARSTISDDIYIFSVADNSEHETYYLGSPHIDVLNQEDEEIAYYRAKALARLLNGCLMLDGDLTLKFSDEIHMFNEKGEYIHTSSGRNNDFNILEYEELRYPFQDDIEIEEKANKSYIRDCIILAKEDKIVHQTLIFLTLSRLDVLYQLNNTYKIFENIVYDQNLPKHEGKYKNTVKGKIPKEFESYLDYFYSGDFRHYANSEMGSHILARHGHSDAEYKNKPPLDLKQLDYNARNLINHWLREKMKKRFGYFYNVEYKQVKEEGMTDEDFDFLRNMLEK